MKINMKFFIIILVFPLLACSQNQTDNTKVDNVHLETITLINYKDGDTLIEVNYSNGFKNFVHKRDFKIDTGNKTITIGSYVEEFGYTYVDDNGNEMHDPPASYYEENQYQYKLENTDKSNIEGTYIHPNGILKVKRLNDSIVEIDIKSENGKKTTLTAEKSKVVSPDLFRLSANNREFYKVNIQGICMFMIGNNRIDFEEFGGLAVLAYLTDVKDLDKTFAYKENTQVEVRGKLKRLNKRTKINDVFISNLSEEYNEDDYLVLKGVVSYDKDIIDGKSWYQYYIKPNEVNKLPTYKGSTLNQEDEALFIWDFADSESYRLNGIKHWSTAYTDKQIEVAGNLVHNESGSVIYDWEILNVEKKK